MGGCACSWLLVRLLGVCAVIVWSGVCASIQVCYVYLLGWNLQVCEVGRCVECARVGVWVLMCLFCVCLCVLGVICACLSVLLVRYL